MQNQKPNFFQGLSAALKGLLLLPEEPDDLQTEFESKSRSQILRECRDAMNEICTMLQKNIEEQRLPYKVAMQLVFGDYKGANKDAEASWLYTRPMDKDEEQKYLNEGRSDDAFFEVSVYENHYKTPLHCHKLIRARLYVGEHDAQGKISVHVGGKIDVFKKPINFETLPEKSENLLGIRTEVVKTTYAYMAFQGKGSIIRASTAAQRPGFFGIGSGVLNSSLLAAQKDKITSTMMKALTDYHQRSLQHTL